MSQHCTIKYLTVKISHIIFWWSFQTLEQIQIFPNLSFPLSEREGGWSWFSWEKKTLGSPFLNWLAMYNRPNKEASFFSWASCFAFAESFFCLGVLKSGSEFLVIGSWVPLVLFSRTSSLNSLYWFFPTVSNFFIAETTGSSTQSLVWRTSSSG